MATSKNSHFTDEDNIHKVLSLKRIITVSSDEEDKEINKNNKRQCSLALPKIQPLKLMNEQPIIRNTKQTSLSIIRTSNADNGSKEGKWNLKTIVSPSNKRSFQSKKNKLTQTVNGNRLKAPYSIRLKLIFENGLSIILIESY